MERQGENNLREPRGGNIAIRGKHKGGGVPFVCTCKKHMYLFAI